MQSIKAARLLAENVSALLARDRLDQHDLAQWCRHSDPWVSDFLRGKRNWTLADLDRVADFFHMVAYQLFIPGISHRTERRSGVDRRSVKERRMGQAQRFMMHTAKEIDGKHPRRKGSPDVLASSPIGDALKRLTADYEKRVTALLQAAADAGQQTPTPGGAVTPPRKSRRVAGGSHAPKD